MLAKFSIRAKISAVIALLIVMLAGMGLLAVKSIGAMNSNTVEIATNWLPSIRVLGELRAGTMDYRRVLREHMLAETLEEKRTVERNLTAIFESTTKSRATYEPMIASPEERALAEAWSKSWENYKNSAREVMALSRKAAGQAPREAHEFSINTANKQAMEADEILIKDIELNDRGAAREIKNAADTYSSTFMMVVAILGVAILIGSAVSFLLVRDVSRGIASIVAPMQALGKGDLTAHVPHRGEQTEIGTMADVLQVFKEALIAKKAADEAATLDAEAKIERPPGGWLHAGIRGDDRGGRQYRVFRFDAA